MRSASIAAGRRASSSSLLRFLFSLPRTARTSWRPVPPPCRSSSPTPPAATTKTCSPPTLGTTRSLPSTALARSLTRLAPAQHQPRQPLWRPEQVAPVSWRRRWRWHPQRARRAQRDRQAAAGSSSRCLAGVSGSGGWRQGRCARATVPRAHRSLHVVRLPPIVGRSMAGR